MNNLSAPFAVAAAFLLIVGFIALVFTAACGEGGVAVVPSRPPEVRIECDSPEGEPRCFVLAQYATSVVGFYNDRPAWWDRDISNPEDRQSYLDSPPEDVEFRVEACSDLGCVSAVERITVAQACDDDCDPNDPICIPCDLEYADQRCRTVCYDLPLGRECVTICEDTYA